MFQNVLRCRHHVASQLTDVANSVYDSKRKEFLGRDGARWGKRAGPFLVTNELLR